ncbi:MAG: hypothetical protein EHM24_00785 [Acidobacteria bacterium]|nr:MAG: hypothetical protein EHM24_15195 [Acidobacteriota bacterium]RPJ77102.1 MAG: hypothetical protein EHM24_00785 [Acidobacteriota bacterium]
MFLSQPVPPNTPLTPIVVQVPDAPVAEIGVIDILLGSFGITGLLLVGSALLGFVAAAVIFWLRRRLESQDPDGASLASAQLGLTIPPAPGTSPRQAP